MRYHITGSLYEIDESSCELHFLSFPAFDGAHERWLNGPVARRAAGDA